MLLPIFVKSRAIHRNLQNLKIRSKGSQTYRNKRSYNLMFHFLHLRSFHNRPLQIVTFFDQIFSPESMPLPIFVESRAVHRNPRNSKIRSKGPRTRRNAGNTRRKSFRRGVGQFYGERVSREHRINAR